jgi:glucose-1-phosphate cytidylyltransferase
MHGMKAVILAGGLGTRLAEETTLRPKPMVEIGGKPILWHIMKTYNHYGVNDFVICLGYKGQMIKEYFLNYGILNSDISVSGSGAVTIHNKYAEDWNVTLADTGEHTQTGGRLLRIRHYLDPNKPFFMTYGDGVSNIDIAATLDFHRKHGKQATVSGVQPSARFGALGLDGTTVSRFQEKPKSEGGYINGGYFVLQPSALDTIANEQIIWEKEPLEALAQAGQLEAYLHSGFWQPMDTLRDKQYLDGLWESGAAEWKVWK